MRFWVRLQNGLKKRIEYQYILDNDYVQIAVYSK